MRSGRRVGMGGDPAGEPLLRSEGDVHVWRVDVSAVTGSSLGASCLDSEERARAGTFRFEGDRKRFIVSHVALRTILSRYVGKPPERLRFDRNENGKPRLCANPRAIEFNLTHSGDWVTVAVTSGRQVGVDIEKVIELPDLEQLVRRCLCDQERNDLGGLNPSVRLAAYYQIWTAKEAYGKCLGTGLALPLRQIHVNWGLPPGRRTFSVAGGEGVPSEIDGRLLDTPTGYVGALAVQGRIRTLSYRVCPADDLCSEGTRSLADRTPLEGAQ